MNNELLRLGADEYLKQKREKYLLRIAQQGDQPENKPFRTAEDLLALNIDEIPMLLPPMLQQVGVAALCGSSDVGKSYLCLNIASSICTGETTSIGMTLNSIHKSVLVVCTEDGEEMLSFRLRSLLKDKNLLPGSMRFIFQTEKLIRTLKVELIRRPVDLIIIDTFGDLFVGSINQSIEIRTFLKPYKELAKEFKCLILFNHHIGKGKENNNSPNKNDVLGSQAIESACRSVSMLRKNSDQKRVLTLVKGNNIPDELKNQGIVLAFDISKGFTPTGDRIDFKSSPDLDEMAQKVIHIYPRVKSYVKVVHEMEKLGYHIHKNKVMDIWNKHLSSIQNPKENDG